MYYPYFRGKQYELITVRDNANIFAAHGFVPIIEPVKSTLSGLQRALDAIRDSGASAVLIVNPHHGNHSTDAQTAVSEIRPHPGRWLCVAEFSVAGTLSLADLREPRRTVSPFSLSSESEVGQLRGDVGFLEYFGEELTRPVIPQAAAIDYIPSQFLCEFIKNCGYDGVVYRSSVGPGINVALFDPDTASIGEISSYGVYRVTVELGDAPD